MVNLSAMVASASPIICWGCRGGSAIQAGLAKAYLRANVMDLYANDDWRILPNLTLNFGLRYEYFAPYTEKDGHLVNLDHSADFQQVSPVIAGQSGPYSGAFPQSLVNPDRTMFAPRLGAAYRPKGAWFKETVIRGGYGVNYNTTQPITFAQQLAFQPPFSVTQTKTIVPVHAVVVLHGGRRAVEGIGQLKHAAALIARNVGLGTEKGGWKASCRANVIAACCS